MNLHAKALSYSMEPCVRILCVRAGRVELRVGCPLFFCAPGESCVFSAGLDSAMQDHTHVCVYEVSIKWSGGCISKSIHILYGVTVKQRFPSRGYNVAFCLISCVSSLKERYHKQDASSIVW